MKRVVARGKVTVYGGAAAIAAVASLVPSYAHAGSRAPCDQRVTSGALQVFQGLPPISRPRLGRQLPFAPRGVFLESSSYTRILTPGQLFGYEFTIPHLPKRGISLDLRVSVLVIRVNSDGDEIGRDVALERVLRRIEDSRSLDELRFSVEMPETVGLYKYRLVVRGLDGVYRGRVEQYVKIAPRRWRPELLTRARYAPGERGVLRIINRGSIPVSFGDGVSIKVHRDGEWKPSRYFPARPARRVATVLFGGETSNCIFFPIPKVTPAGSYRIEKDVSSRSRSSADTVTATFKVDRR